MQWRSTGGVFDRNAVGSITQIAEPAASDRNFGYDALQRLVSGGTAALPETYSYDAEDLPMAFDGAPG